MPNGLTGDDVDDLNRRRARRIRQVVLDGRAWLRILACPVLVARHRTALAEVRLPQHGFAGWKEMERARHDFVVHALQGRHVVHDVDAAAVSGQNEIVLPRMHQDVVDPHHRQAGHETIPADSVVH